MKRFGPRALRSSSQVLARIVQQRNILVVNSNARQNRYYSIAATFRPPSNSHQQIPLPSNLTPSTFVQNARLMHVCCKGMASANICMPIVSLFASSSRPIILQNRFHTNAILFNESARQPHRSTTNTTLQEDLDEAARLVASNTLGEAEQIYKNLIAKIENQQIPDPLTQMRVHYELAKLNFERPFPKIEEARAGYNKVIEIANTRGYKGLDADELLQQDIYWNNSVLGSARASNKLNDLQGAENVLNMAIKSIKERISELKSSDAPAQGSLIDEYVLTKLRLETELASSYLAAFQRAADLIVQDITATTKVVPAEAPQQHQRMLQDAIHMLQQILVDLQHYDDLHQLGVKLAGESPQLNDFELSFFDVKRMALHELGVAYSRLYSSKDKDTLRNLDEAINKFKTAFEISEKAFTLVDKKTGQYGLDYAENLFKTSFTICHLETDPNLKQAEEQRIQNAVDVFEKLHAFYTSLDVFPPWIARYIAVFSAKYGAVLEALKELKYEEAVLKKSIEFLSLLPVDYARNSYIISVRFLLMSAHFMRNDYDAAWKVAQDIQAELDDPVLRKEYTYLTNQSEDHVVAEIKLAFGLCLFQQKKRMTEAERFLRDSLALYAELPEDTQRIAAHQISMCKYTLNQLELIKTEREKRSPLGFLKEIFGFKKKTKTQAATCD